MMGTPRSFKIRFSQTDSNVVTTTSLYSASVLDSAIVGSFLLLEEITTLPREKTCPDVDLLLAL